MSVLRLPFGITVFPRPIFFVSNLEWWNIGQKEIAHHRDT